MFNSRQIKYYTLKALKSFFSLKSNKTYSIKSFVRTHLKHQSPRINQLELLVVSFISAHFTYSISLKAKEIIIRGVEVSVNAISAKE